MTTPTATKRPRAFAVWFAELRRWSVSSFHAVRWHWSAKDIAPLSKALERKRIPVDKSVGLDNLQLVTLHFDGTMEPRDTGNKTTFKGKLFEAVAGDVVYSKIDVRNGAIGVVPSEMPKVAVSSEYPVYRVRANVALPEYVKLLFHTTAFRRQINSMISGASGRKRVQPSDLEKVDVPLPPLPVQCAIVEHWNKAQAEADAYTQNIGRVECHIEARVLSLLGIDVRPFIRRQKCFVLPWRDVDRWGVEFNRWGWGLGDIFKGKYPLRRLGELASVNPRPVAELSPSDKVSFVSMETVDAESGRILDAEQKKLAEVRQGFTAFQDGDVLWAKITPCMQNGKCALAKDLTNGVGYGSTEFHVLRPKDTAVLAPQFLWVLLRLRRLREAAQRYFIGSAGQQRVPPDFLRELPIPIPPLSVQEGIVAEVQQRRAEIAAARRKAEDLAEQAKAEVEAMILGARPVEGTTT